MKCIFSIALVGKLEKLQESFSPDDGPEAPDAVSVHLVCSECLAQLGLGTGSQAPDIGLSLFVRPVVRVRCVVRLCTSLHMRPVNTGQSVAQRPVTLRVCRLLIVLK